MRTLGKIAATLGVIGAIAVGSVVQAFRIRTRSFRGNHLHRKTR